MPKKEEHEKLCVYIDRELVSKIEELALRTSFSKSAICGNLLKLAFKKYAENPAELGADIFTTSTSTSTPSSRTTVEPSSTRGKV